MRRLLTAFALSVLAFAPAAAAGDPPPDWAKSWIGPWTMSGASEGGFSCSFRVLATPTIGGMAVKMTPACRKYFPVEDVAAFTLGPKGEPRLINALRHAELSFRRAGEDWMATPPHGGDDIVLARGSGENPLQPPEGTWSLSGPNGDPSCGFTIRSDKSHKAGTLKRAGRCAPRWAKLSIARWSRAKGAMTLADKAGKTLMTLQGPDGFSVYVHEDSKAGPTFFGPGTIEGQ